MIRWVFIDNHFICACFSCLKISEHLWFRIKSMTTRRFNIALHKEKQISVAKYWNVLSSIVSSLLFYGGSNNRVAKTLKKMHCVINPLPFKFIFLCKKMLNHRRKKNCHFLFFYDESKNEKYLLYVFHYLVSGSGHSSFDLHNPSMRQPQRRIFRCFGLIENASHQVNIWWW